MLLAAGGLPDPWTLFVFTAGVWLTRSAVSRCATPGPHSLKGRDMTNGRRALLTALIYWHHGRGQPDRRPGGTGIPRRSIMEFIVWADRKSDARKVRAADMAAAIEAACSMFGVEADEVNIINAESVNGGPNVGEAEYYGVSHAL